MVAQWSICVLTLVEALIAAVSLQWQTENRPHACQQHNSNSEQRTTDYTPPFLTPVFMSVLTCVAVRAVLRCVEGRVRCCLSREAERGGQAMRVEQGQLHGDKASTTDRQQHYQQQSKE